MLCCLRYHLVATFKHGVDDNQIFVQQVGSSEELKNENYNFIEDEFSHDSFKIGGIPTQSLNVYIPILRVFNKRLNETEVRELYMSDENRFGNLFFFQCHCRSLN